jgi:crotonobetainyl-CoA:carnitine CoA-transferase CaiB-like acyl-CoA transferase
MHTHTNAYWLAQFAAAGIPSGLVLIYGQTLTHPHVLARDMVVPDPANDGRNTLGIPIKLSATPGALRRPAPRLGKHSDDILAELGLG